MRNWNEPLPQFNTSIKERNTMETKKFKYDRFFSVLKKEKRKFDKRLNNPHPTWSKDDTKVYNKFVDLFDEVQWLIMCGDVDY